MSALAIGVGEVQWSELAPEERKAVAAKLFMIAVDLVRDAKTKRKDKCALEYAAMQRRWAQVYLAAAKRIEEVDGEVQDRMD